MTLEELNQRIADNLGKTKASELAPIVSAYGPALVNMTAEETWSWIISLAKTGDETAAYNSLVEKMTAPELIDELRKNEANWAKANVENSQRLSLISSARSAVLGVLLKIAVVSVGL